MKILIHVLRIYRYTYVSRVSWSLNQFKPKSSICLPFTHQTWLAGKSLWPSHILTCKNGTIINSYQLLCVIPSFPTFTTAPLCIGSSQFPVGNHQGILSWGGGIGPGHTGAGQQTLGLGLKKQNGSWTKSLPGWYFGTCLVYFVPSFGNLSFFKWNSTIEVQIG